ncbi:hypothetical protein [Deinococcus ruber]|nr:hypothetical protein [Deinococcus ruber]
MLHTVLLHPLIPNAPLLWQLNVLQALSLLLAACAAHRGLSAMVSRSYRIWGSAEVMLSLVLLSCVLISTLPIWEDVTSQVAAGLVVRSVLGGLFVQCWHLLARRVHLRFV